MERSDKTFRATFDDALILTDHTGARVGFKWHDHIQRCGLHK